MADNLYLPQIDYTSRDYAAIRQDLLNLIPNYAPQWTSRDSTDFGVVLLELFAYMGDLLNYYIDRAANESFIDTATQRDTVLNWARMFNYTPNEIAPSTGTIKFQNTSALNSATLPALTQVAATSTNGETIIFETSTAVTVPASSTSANIGVTQGYTVSTESIGISDGTADQEFRLTNPYAVTSGQTVNGVTSYSLSMYVNGTAWSKATSFLDYNNVGTSANVFVTSTDGDGYTYIKFGDGTHGNIPALNSTITSTYRVAVGSAGNIADGAINGILGLPNGSYPSGVIITEASATSGGTDAESTDSIRLNAPKALRSLNRAVSINDYSNLALQVAGVAKAKAVASVYTSISLYIAASGGNALSSSLSTTISNFFTDKMPPGASVTVYDYAPVYPDIRVNVSVYNQYKAADVNTMVLNALYELLAFDNVSFNDVITASDVYNVVASVPGVKSAVVTGLTKKTTSNNIWVPVSVNDIYCNVNEIPMLDKSYIAATMIGGTI